MRGKLGATDHKKHSGSELWVKIEMKIPQINMKTAQKKEIKQEN